MLRRTDAALLRLLCLTMLPDGGALKPALKQLGYTPYTLRSSFQNGHASTHPIAWSAALDGSSQALPPSLLADYDTVLGPPGAMLYTTLLRQAPQYTKVILVEEADKDRWAVDYEAYMARLQKATKSASKNKIARAFQNMLAKMVVGGDATSAAAAVPSASNHDGTLKEAASVSKASAAAATGSRSAHMTASSSDLRKSFAAQAAALKGGSVTSKSTEGSTEKGEEDKDGSAEGGLRHPRAIALQLYEESVKMSVLPSQLLVYRYGDGWEPLCSFLEKPVPAVPFPEYDDGLRVLGNLQERIEYARMLQLLLGGLCVVCLLVTILPQCGGVVQFFKDLYTDYQMAFGTDSDTASGGRRAAAAGDAAPQSEADKFDEEWRRRGGSVTRTKSA